MTHTPSGRRLFGLSLAALASLQWGAQPVILKILVDTLDVYTIGWMRFATTAVLLLPLSMSAKGFQSLKQLNGRGLFLLLICVASLLTNYLTFMASLSYISPGSAQIFMQIGPMLMLVGGLVVFGETFTRLQWVGCAILIVGLTLFFSNRFGDLVDDSKTFGFGFTLLIIAALTWAVYLLTQKQLLTLLQPQTILLCIYSAGAILLFPVIRLTDYTILEPRHIPLLAATSILTFSSYLCYANSLKHVEASRIGVVLSFSPVVVFFMAALFSLFLPDLIEPENLSIANIAGSCLVVAGSMLGAWGNFTNLKKTDS